MFNQILNLPKKSIDKSVAWLTESTEVLTRNGWQKVSNIVGGGLNNAESVLTITEEGKFKFVRITATSKLMFKDTNIHVVTTPECYMEFYTGSPISKTAVLDLLKVPDMEFTWKSIPYKGALYTFTTANRRVVVRHPHGTGDSEGSLKQARTSSVLTTAVEIPETPDMPEGVISESTAEILGIIPDSIGLVNIGQESHYQALLPPDWYVMEMSW